MRTTKENKLGRRQLLFLVGLHKQSTQVKVLLGFLTVVFLFGIISILRMLRSPPIENRVYSTWALDRPNSPNYRIYLAGGTPQRAKSFWHDIKAFPEVNMSSATDEYPQIKNFNVATNSSPYIVNFVCEIAKSEVIKFEMLKSEIHNPIYPDSKRSVVRKYPWPSMFNYGFVPQTYEHPGILDSITGFKGDGDPIDFIDLCPIGCIPGDYYAVQISGALAMVQDEETDWKVFGTRVGCDGDTFQKGAGDLSQLNFDPPLPIGDNIDVSEKPNYDLALGPGAAHVVRPLASHFAKEAGMTYAITHGDKPLADNELTYAEREVRTFLEHAIPAAVQWFADYKRERAPYEPNYVSPPAKFTNKLFSSMEAATVVGQKYIEYCLLMQSALNTSVELLRDTAHLRHSLRFGTNSQRLWTLNPSMPPTHSTTPSASTTASATVTPTGSSTYTFTESASPSPSAPKVQKPAPSLGPVTVPENPAKADDDDTSDDEDDTNVAASVAVIPKRRLEESDELTLLREAYERDGFYRLPVLLERLGLDSAVAALQAQPLDALLREDELEALLEPLKSSEEMKENNETSDVRRKLRYVSIDQVVMDSELDWSLFRFAQIYASIPHPQGLDTAEHRTLMRMNDNSLRLGLIGFLGVPPYADSESLMRIRGTNFQLELYLSKGYNRLSNRVEGTPPGYDEGDVKGSIKSQKLRAFARMPWTMPHPFQFFARTDMDNIVAFLQNTTSECAARMTEEKYADITSLAAFLPLPIRK